MSNIQKTVGNLILSIDVTDKLDFDTISYIKNMYVFDKHTGILVEDLDESFAKLVFDVANIAALNKMIDMHLES